MCIKSIARSTEAGSSRLANSIAQRRHEDLNSSYIFELYHQPIPNPIIGKRNGVTS